MGAFLFYILAALLGLPAAGLVFDMLAALAKWLFGLKAW